MKLLFLFVFVLFIWSSSCYPEMWYTSDVTQQWITNPTSISAFKFNARVRPYRKAPGIPVVSPTQYTYTCQLRINKKSSGIMCVGTLVNSNSLLTSRSCVENATQILVVCGSASNSKTYTVSAFSNVQMWPTYKSGEYINFAVVKLQTPITFNKYISTVRIPSVNMDYTSSNVVALNRFQRTRIAFNGILQYSAFTVINSTVCPSSTSFCSQLTNKKKNFRSGYLGGPMVLREADGNDTVIGINYGSVANGRNKYLQISIKIANFIYFIIHTTGVDYEYKLHAGTCLSETYGFLSPSSYWMTNLYEGLFSIYDVFSLSYNFRALGYIDNACLEWDGNLVFYGNNTALWKSGTSGSYMILFLTSDGSLEFYKGFVNSSTFVKKLTNSCENTPEPQNGMWDYITDYSCTFL